MRDLVYLENVVTLQLDTEKCIGCGKCTEVCPHAVIAKANGTPPAFEAALVATGALATLEHPLAERQDGYLTLRDRSNNRYELDLAVPLSTD